MAKILIIEDDKYLAGIARDWLEREHHLVDYADTSKDGYGYLSSFEYDLIILDWSLPDGSGVELCQDLRARGNQAAVLMTTGKGSIAEKATGFNAGADDYLAKPYDIRELCMRVQALLRRHKAADSKISARGVVLDIASRSVTAGARNCKVSPRDFDLLEFFLRHQEQCFSVDMLLKRVWPSDSSISVDAVRQSIKRLREEIDVAGEPSIITTVRGLGYKFSLNPSVNEAE